MVNEAKHDEWITYLQNYEKEYPLSYDKNSLTGPQIIEEIYKATKGEAIITTDVGQHQMWASQYYKYTSSRTLITSGGLGTMGYGLGAAIGAKTGCPDKIVVNIDVYKRQQLKKEFSRHHIVLCLMHWDLQKRN